MPQEFRKNGTRQFLCEAAFGAVPQSKSFGGAAKCRGYVFKALSSRRGYEKGDLRSPFVFAYTPFVALNEP
ncbi:hypothetical protein BZM27_03320 [Paraburkholderia steynii]|uniref:Uncharacterized protein n=1 Tax=Paraburkholderia steynii TaxID=1245441 RepID=A0A4R0XQ77_9BURK|nr:hypothetical protein BZM27_03320 [Paraburkholderia steynii]